MKRAICVLVVTAATIVGCGKKKDFEPRAVIDEVVPPYALTGRTQQVEMHGDFTRWSNVTVDDVSFGEGVTVDAVSVANPEVVVATITTDASATIGVRDVQVKKQVLAGVFEVRPPFEIVGGSPAVQGAYFKVVVEGLETEWADGYTEVSVVPPPGVAPGDGGVFVQGSTGPLFTIELGPRVVDEDTLEIIGYADIFSTPGGYGLEINAGQHDDVVLDALTVEAATFTTVDAGSSEVVTTQGAFSTAYVRVAPTPGDHVSVEGELAGGVPAIAIYSTDEETTASGVTVPQNVYSLLFGASSLTLLDTYVDSSANEEFILVLYDAYALAKELEIPVVPLADDAATPVSVEMTFDESPLNATPLTDGVPDTMLTLGINGVHYHDVPSNPWAVSTFDLSPTGTNVAGRVMREGTLSADYQFVNDGNTGSQKVANGASSSITYEVSDNAGMAGSYDVTWSEATPPGGMLYQTGSPTYVAGATAVTNATVVGGVGTVIPSIVDIPIEVTAGVNPIANLVVMTDLSPATCAEVYLRAPNNSSALLQNSCAARVASYGASTVDAYTTNAADISGVLTSPISGTWTLRLYNYELLAGQAQWALYVVPN